ncbi:MAG: asparagine synthase (glutamine-hydrolyzing) [Blastocatellia bacterium]
MCGIAGIYNYKNDQPINETVLRRMTAALIHRGPDDEGFHLAGRVGLGHRRLSIIDVAGGHQPVFNEDGSIAIILNGEIYNYRELAKLVEARGHRLRTQSDTETIVHLYEEFGEACVEHLRGMFAFALWDLRQQKLLLARDRVGKKPLYFADVGGILIFGSELKALLEHPAMSREVDSLAVADYFSYQFIPAPKTIYASARKLRAGHCLVVTPNGASERQYWDINFNHFNQAEQRSEAEWSEMLMDEFRSAVENRLIGEVSLGAFLSSGVDSSAVVAMMNRINSRPVITATVGFSEERFSEADDARVFAESLNADHHERIVTPDAVGVIEKLAWHFDEPFADASAIPTFYVSQAAREFVTVALSGDGGDESFAGYRRYAFDAMENRMRKLAPVRPLFGALAAIYPKADWLPQPLRAKATLRNLSLDPARAYFNSVYGAMVNERDGLLGREVCAELRGYDPFEVFAEHYKRPTTDDSLARAQYADIKLYLADDILTKVDRASMAVSLEARCPLLDHRLMELAARIPSSLKLRGREGKHIFKRAVGHLLPPEILNRRKQGFVVPLAEWLRGDLRELAESLLFDATANDGWLERSAIRKLWQRHQSGWAGLRDYSRPLWAVLMFRMWQRTFQQ